jgi:hypothetical protein
MVLAGKGQDKNVTNTIVEWKEVGINLGRANPSVDEIREGVMTIEGYEIQAQCSCYEQDL